MASDYYEIKTARGILVIRLIGGTWELGLYTDEKPNGVLIRSGYTNPDQAAFDASRADFGIQEFDDLFRGVYVPSDVWQWRKRQLPYMTGSGRP